MSDKVVLRRWKTPYSTGEGDLIALFPEMPADDFGFRVNSYMTIGQHGEADYEHVISVTKPVLWWGKDVLEFLEELRRIGYDPDVRQRCTPQMRNARRLEASRTRA